MTTKKKKDLNLDFIVLSDYAFLGQRGKLSLIGVFDLIGVKKTPSIHPELFLVARLKGKPNSKHKVQLGIKDPLGNNMLGEKAPTFNITVSPNGAAGITHRFLNFPIKHPGEHLFILREGKEKLGEVKLMIIKVKDNEKSRNSPN